MSKWNLFPQTEKQSYLYMVSQVCECLDFYFSLCIKKKNDNSGIRMRFGDIPLVPSCPLNALYHTPREPQAGQPHPRLIILGLE